MVKVKRVFQTPRFARVIESLNKSEKTKLDEVVRIIANKSKAIVKNHSGFSYLKVYHFKLGNQFSLLAYSSYKEKVILEMLSIGQYQNFYRNLDRLNKE